MAHAEQKVLLGFTGGVRSTVAAALLRSQGLDVQALYVDLSEGDFSLRCRDDSRRQAEEQAAALGIPLLVVNGKEVFASEVIDAYLHAALDRRTPQSCLNCHLKVVFPVLFKQAEQLRIRTVVTGHRASLNAGDLAASTDAGEQASWLAFLSRAQLDRLLLPLGDLSAMQIEKLAGELDFAPQAADRVVRRQCRIPASEWEEWLTSATPTAFQAPGPIRMDASVGLGEALGPAQYPLGSEVPIHSQAVREALPHRNFSGQETLIAASYDPVSRTLLVLPGDEVHVTEVAVEEINWVEKGQASAKTGILVEVQSPGLFGAASVAPVKATVFFHMDRKARVLFNEPVQKLFSGSPLAFVKEGRVLGSAWVI